MAADWNLSCLDWQDRIKSGRSLLPDLPLIKAESDRAVSIFNRLRLPDVPGQPLMEHAVGDWFRDAVRALFGSYDPKTNTRYIRELFQLVPKKSSKTTGGAALMLTAMLMSRRPRAEFLIVAPTLDVADLAFRQTVGMIEADEVLSAKCHIQEHLKRITYRPTGAFLKVKSFDPKIVTGSKPAGVLLDELHVIAEAHDADRVIGQLRGGLISQPEGFMVTITTQSERPPAGVFKAELKKARAVRDGELRAPILPLIYELPPDVDWRNSANWHMVTPNNGRSITVERLIPDFQAAESSSIEELARWASQHLNVEIGVGLRTNSWAGAHYWLKRAVDRDGRGNIVRITLESLIERCEVAVIGIDGGGLRDFLGLAVLGRERETRRWLLWTRAWASELMLQERKSELAQLNDFISQGDLHIFETPGPDLDAVADIVCQVRDAGLLPEKNAIGVDQNGIGALIDKLVDPDRGIQFEQIIGISQGWRLTAAIKTTERRVASGELIHDGRPLMTWCVQNAKVEPRGNAILVTKEVSGGDGKIDPLMAVFDAVSLMALNPEATVFSGELLTV
jgi:phage terminase large subunit-like protein